MSKWQQTDENEPKRRKKNQLAEPIKDILPVAEHNSRINDTIAPQIELNPLQIESKSNKFLSLNPTSACNHVDTYEKLNLIDEGSYGIVYRARNRSTNEIVALKKLKLTNENNGFPLTSLREIHALMRMKHENVVAMREVVAGNDKSIFIVMEFVEHDLKSLMDSMTSPFLQSERTDQGCWYIHLCFYYRKDFGLARKYTQPLGKMTQLVVTLWYRSPELLLGATDYSTPIDLWSIGCIYAELINKEPLFPGKGEIDQVAKIFKLLGKPTHKNWPGFEDLPLAQTFSFSTYTHNLLRTRFTYLTSQGLDLLSRLLCYDPSTRITASTALKHPYFTESPAPQDPSLFPTFPSKGAGERKVKRGSPSAPHGHDEPVNDYVAKELLREIEEEKMRATLGAYTGDSGGFRLKY